MNETSLPPATTLSSSASWRKGARAAIRFLIPFAGLVVAAQPAPAAEGGEPTAEPSLPDALKTFTDPQGLRASLAKAGLAFTFSAYGDVLANPTGGVQQGPGFSGRFGAIVDGDLEKLAGLSGASFHASLHAIYGYGLSVNNLDNMMLVSSVEAPNALRLFNLWIEQKMTEDTSLRVGQYTAAQEFLVSKNAGLFVNATFGWPVLPAQDLPGGGPAYPEGALGARILYRPNEQIAFRAAVFDGDPSGPGSANPVTRDPYGLAFRLRDAALMIAEAVYHYNQAGPEPSQDNLQQEGDRAAWRVSEGMSLDQNLPGTVKLGAWYQAGSFADPRLNTQGGWLASGGAPLEHGGNYSAYGVLDQMIWRAEAGGDRGLSLFLRVTAAPGDRNPIDLYGDAGLTLQGPFVSRPADAVGLAFAFGRVSPQVAAYDRQWDAETKIAMPIRDYEAALELTYQIQLAKNWTLQPDFQFIVHPGGNIANPQIPGGATPIANAVVVGFRSVLKF